MIRDRQGVPYEDSNLYPCLVVRNCLKNKLLVEMGRDMIIFSEHAKNNGSFTLCEEFGGLWIVIDEEISNECHEDSRCKKG